jgi:HPr Serine kinase C-terminal domain
MTDAAAKTWQSIPATTIVIGDVGIAIRGASGSGKSSLAIALIETVKASRFARLVADDVTRIEAKGGRIIARTVPQMTGFIERRGLGIVPITASDAVVLRLVVDCLGTDPQRLPDPEMLVTTLLGVTLPLVSVAGQPRDVSLVLTALDLMYSGRSS